MTICKNFFRIEFCVPGEINPLTETEWTMMKTEFPDEKVVEKKLTFFRQEFPGRDWRIWKVEQRESIHAAIESSKKK
jgi:hypothetical protein